MNSRSCQLAERREVLVLRCQAQREQLARVAPPLELALRIGDRALGLMSWLRAHPVLSGLAVAAVMVASRGRMLRWISAALPFVGMAIRAGRALRRN